MEDFRVGEPKNREPEVFQKAIPFEVGFSVFRVVVAVAVYLDDDFGMEGTKIHDVRADGDLAVELDPQELPSAKGLPEEAFRGSKVSAKLPGPVPKLSVINRPFPAHFFYFNPPNPL